MPELSEVDELDQQILAHYASEYYDPAKARQYYLERRELQGRKKGQKESESDRNKREATSFVKKEIGSKRRAETSGAVKAQAARLENLRNKADETRARITAKLEKLIADVQAKTAKDLIPIPANASPKLRAYLEKQNAQTRAAASKDIQGAKKSAAVDRKAVGLELRGAVEKARSSYNESKAQMKAKYDQALVTEQKNIQENVQ